MTYTLPPCTVAADRYPTPCMLPDGTRLSRARVIITAPDADAPGRLRVFTAVGPPVFDEAWDPLASWVGSRGVDWSIGTDAGTAVISPGAGCRCGRLGSWTPFDGPERRESITKVVRRAREAAGLEGAS